MTQYHSGKPPLISPEVPALYKQAIKTVASEWSENTPEYTQTPGSRRVYSEMREILSERMKEAGAPVRVMDSGPNHSGFEVVSNFLYAGAAKAALVGFSMTDLRSALYQPTSFRQLVPFTQETNTSARDMEIHLGLTDSGGARLNSYTLTESGLVMDNSDLIVAAINGRRRAQEKAARNDEELPEYDGSIRCVGMKSGLVTYAYRYMLDICMADPALFHATIENGQQMQASVAKTLADHDRQSA